MPSVSLPAAPAGQASAAAADVQRPGQGRGVSVGCTLGTGAASCSAATLTPGSCSHQCSHHTVVFCGEHVTSVTDRRGASCPSSGPPSPFSTAWCLRYRPLCPAGLQPQAPGPCRTYVLCPGLQGSWSSCDVTPEPRVPHQDQCWPLCVAIGTVKNPHFRHTRSVGLTLMLTGQARQEASA